MKTKLLCLKVLLKCVNLNKLQQGMGSTSVGAQRYGKEFTIRNISTLIFLIRTSGIENFNSQPGCRDTLCKNEEDPVLHEELWELKYL